LAEARRRLREYWNGNGVRMVLDVTEFKTTEGVYGMVISPVGNAVDPGRFMHAVVAAIGSEPKMVKDSFPKFANAVYLSTWKFGSQTLDEYRA